MLSNPKLSLDSKICICPICMLACGITSLFVSLYCISFKFVMRRYEPDNNTANDLFLFLDLFTYDTGKQTIIILPNTR